MPDYKVAIIMNHNWLSFKIISDKPQTSPVFHYL